MKVIEFINNLPEKTFIVIRGAFQSGYGDDENKPDYYKGLKARLPIDFEHNNKTLISCYWCGEYGDVCKIEEAYGIDIAVGDYDE